MMGNSSRRKPCQNDFCLVCGILLKEELFTRKIYLTFWIVI